MPSHADLLIVGAGPFGLALALEARHRGVDHLVVGRPMEFWHRRMPAGMYLRSGVDWHLDPTGTHTIARYLAERGRTPADAEPLALATYLDYAAWLQEQAGVEAYPVYVERLDALANGALANGALADGGGWDGTDGDGPRFRATLDDGATVLARHVAVAVGFRYFEHLPAELVARVPASRLCHTGDLVDLAAMRGRRCLILGGRQSAFEWAALLREAGAAAVHVVHRHPSPAFQTADWSWVPPLVDRMVDDPGWFRRLSADEQQALRQRLWAEGRLKVEPWLEPRVRHASVSIHPGTELVRCEPLPGGALRAVLTDGAEPTVDHVVLATGYKPQADRVPFLAAGNLLDRIATRDGVPLLDERMQTSAPGLFMTSMLAARDFGPFFAFTVSARASARIIGAAVAKRAAPAPAA